MNPSPLIPLPIGWGEGKPFERLFKCGGFMVTMRVQSRGRAFHEPWTGRCHDAPHPDPLPIGWEEGEDPVTLWSQCMREAKRNLT